MATGCRWTNGQVERSGWLIEGSGSLSGQDTRPSTGEAGSGVHRYSSTETDRGNPRAEKSNSLGNYDLCREFSPGAENPARRIGKLRLARNPFSTDYVRTEKQASRTLANWLTLGFLVLFGLTAGGCVRRLEGDPWGGTTKLRVLVTIVPWHCLTAAIAEPEADVRCLCITNGPHEFQPTAEEARLLNVADLVIANGLGLEGFLVPMLRGSGRKDLPVLRVAEEMSSRGAALIEVPGYEHEGHRHGPGNDPHVWLGLPEAELALEVICERLCQARPEHKELFQQRRDQVRQRLANLRRLAEPLAQSRGALVTAHDAFRYLARSVFGPEYDQRVIPVRGLHGEELAAADFDKLVMECRRKQVRAFATEPRSSPVILHRIQESLGEKLPVIELDPLETAEPDPQRRFYVRPGWYFEVMEKNLRQLQEAFRP